MRVDIVRGHQTRGETVGELPWIFGKFPPPVAGGGLVAIVVVLWLVEPILGVVAGAIALWDFIRFRRANIKFHTVTLAIMFSEEEKQIIKENQLESVVILERAPDIVQRSRKLNAIERAQNGLNVWEGAKGIRADPRVWYLRFSDILGGKQDRQCFVTPLEAKGYEAALTDALPDVKGFLSGNLVQDGELGRRTMEF